MISQYIPIEVIAVFGTDGMPTPSKFKICAGDDSKVIKIDKIIEIDNTIFYCGATYVYKCRSVIRNQEKIYRIMYNIPKCRWYYLKEN